MMPKPLARINPRPRLFPLLRALYSAEGGVVGVGVGRGVRVGKGVMVGRGWVGVGVDGVGVAVIVGVAVGSAGGMMTRSCPSKTWVVPWLNPVLVKI